MTQPENPAHIGVDDYEESGTFNPNDYDWETHLKRAIEELPVKRVRVDVCWKYYTGDHPRLWITDVVKDKLDKELVENMSENYCDLAVDAPVKRMYVHGFTSVGSKDVAQVDQTATFSKACMSVWDDNKMGRAQKDIYTNAGVAGEAFVFAWKDVDKPSGFDFTIKDARNVWWPEDVHTADPSRVVLLWADEDEGVWRATIYYRLNVVRLVGPKLKQDAINIPQARWWSIDPVNPGGPHGFEKVPVVRFSHMSKRRSVIETIRSLQDKLNKLAANLLVTAEFNAWRKMVVLTEQRIEDGTLNFRPNRVPVLDPGGGDNGAAPTSIWEGAASELSNFSNEQDKLIDRLFTKANLPGHMKVASGKVAPSGAAYEADEGPFTEYVADMQDSYGQSFADLFELCLGVDVKPQWRNPHIKSDFDEAQTTKTFVDAGLPLALTLKRYAGWTDDELLEIANAPLSPKEQLAEAASKALAEGGPAPEDNVQDQPAKTPPKPPVKA